MVGFRGLGRRSGVVREIVVVFYRLEGCGFAEEAEVVDRHGSREEEGKR